MSADGSCSFHSFHSLVVCSDVETFSSLDLLPSTLSSIILTESGLIYGELSNSFNICKNHLSSIQEKNRLRRRGKCCGIPQHLASHQLRNQKRSGKQKADRQMTIHQVEDINRKYGTILPVGTPICASCRAKLFKEGNIEDGVQTCETAMEQSMECSGLLLRPRIQIQNDENENMESSQETSMDTCSQESQVSESSISGIDRLSKLNEFLAACNKSPVKTLRESFVSSSQRTRRRYAAKANECLSLLLETICPGESDALKDAMFSKLETSYTHYESPSLIEALTESYLKAETPTIRRQILSVLTTQASFQDVNAMIPSVTQHKFYSAKKHARELGVGVPVPHEKQAREKVDSSKLEHFLDFITSSHVIKDLPLGEKTLTLTTGELIQTPYVIRCLAPATIVRQYSQLCLEENFEAIGQSTMYKILSECSAAVRRSVEGVDYYVAEASEAFRELEHVVREMQIPLNEQKRMLENLMKAKYYLKADYKMHVRTSSNVADHCLAHALSQVDSIFFEENCSHEHTHACLQCNELDELLSSLTKLTKTMDWDNPDAYMFKVQRSVTAIKDLKAHVLRSKNQDVARVDITANLEDGDLFVVADWAMKFLPRKFREGQTDWFGKRGINWHIAVCATKHNDIFELVTYVHVLDTQSPQDSKLTAALIVDVVKDIASRKNIQKVHLWSDNAGCYKSTYTLHALYQELHPLIKTHNFCEAQDGKGPCDRKASHIKSAIKRYVNEGNDVLDASQMKKAIDTQQKGQYKIKVVTPVIDADAEKASVKAIPNISSLNNFEFSPDGLRVWKAYNIGPGKLLPWTSATVPFMQLNVIKPWTNEVNPAVLSPDDEIEITERNEFSESVPKKRKTVDHVFSCPNENCDRSFRTLTSLENHNLLGNCSDRSERNLLDRCKIMYQNKLSALNTTCPSYDEGIITRECTEPIKQTGWALKMKKPKVLFTEDQKDYLTEIFKAGKTTGKKEDPSKVARDMPYVLINGRKRFGMEDYLTPTQVASFFSRLSQKDRKCDAGDFLAASSDRNLNDLKDEILSHI